MEADLEGLATADAAAAEMARASRHTLPLGTPCANCRTPVQGAWCHVCGQKAEAYHRSILHLISEAFEGLTHMDGRVWTTLRRLILQPGRLTRDYLDGRRASQIPPFRLYLVVLLVLFMAGSVTGKGGLSGLEGKGASHEFKGVDSIEFKQAPNSKVEAWLQKQVVAAARDPEQLVSAMEHWSHQFAILFILVAAPLLTLAYAFQRQFYVYDHLIFSMHSLSFQGLLLATTMILGTGWGGAGILLFLAPVHLFAHMRGVYGSSIFGTLLRMAFLFLGSSVGFAILMTLLVLVGLAQVH